MKTIYLDNNATTRIDDRVRRAMSPFLGEDFGNASSRLHVIGRRADYAVEVARQSVANLVGADDLEEIFFTPGATQSGTMCLLGVATASGRRNRIVTTTIEHQAILESVKHLGEHGFEVVRVPVGSDGLLDMDRMQEVVDERTLIVSISLANNVVGTAQPVAEIAKMTQQAGALIHVDCAQGLGLLPFNVSKMGIDFASFSAHKLYGPKGAGALYIRDRKKASGWGVWDPRGTLNVAGIVGFGAAATIMRDEGRQEAERVRGLRDWLVHRLRSEASIRIHGTLERRHPGNVNFIVPKLDTYGLANLREAIAFSHGSACSTSTFQPSHVLTAMGIEPTAAKAAIRMCVGRFNTREEIDEVCDRIVRATRESEHADGQPRMVVNCEGRRVPAMAGQEALCVVNAAGRYLGESEQLPSLTDRDKPRRINILVPSYCSGPELGATLVSLLQQVLLLPSELIVMINQPPNASREVIEQNDVTERWIRDLDKPAHEADVPAKFREIDTMVREALATRSSNLHVTWLRETIYHGINGVYRTVISSFVACLKRYAEKMSPVVSEQRQVLEALTRRTLLLFVDDDMSLSDRTSVQDAYREAVTTDAVVHGRYQLRSLDSEDRWGATLTNCMQLWLDIKHELGANALSPKGMLLRHALEIPPIDLSSKFADQVYFASLASTRSVHTIAVRTTIEERDYPSNGMFLRDLRRYMAGDNNSALAIFENLLALEWPSSPTYSQDELRELIAVMRTRDIDQVWSRTRALLEREPKAIPIAPVLEERVAAPADRRKAMR